MQSLGLDCRGCRDGLCFRTDVQLAEFLAVKMRQAGLEIASVRLSKLSFDGPVFLGVEGLDRGLPLADQPQGDRLHAPGRSRAGELAPQHRRNGETDEIIECPPCPVGVNQLGVQLPGLRHRGEDGGFRHLVENHAFHGFAIDQVAVLQQLQNMPADGFAFAVGVGRQDEAVRLAKGAGNFTELFFRAAGHLPFHLEIFIRQDRAVLARQVTDMSV